jgi:ABC-2 type transport system ATP-binding protein
MIHVGLEHKDEELREAVTKLSEVRSASFLSPMEPEDVISTKVVLKAEAQTHANAALVQLIQLFNQKDVEMLSLETLEPNLESVFLHLTGKSLRQ